MSLLITMKECGILLDHPPCQIKFGVVRLVLILRINLMTAILLNGIFFKLDFEFFNQMVKLLTEQLSLIFILLELQLGSIKLTFCVWKTLLKNFREVCLLACILDKVVLSLDSVKIWLEFTFWILNALQKLLHLCDKWMLFLWLRLLIFKFEIGKFWHDLLSPHHSLQVSRAQLHFFDSCREEVNNFLHKLV